MGIRGKIQDIDNLSRQEIQEGANYYDLDREICVIDGETYPMFYAKIINKMEAKEMPFIMFLGKPGSGKTYAAAELGYTLHHDIGYYTGEYTTENNINYDNLEYLKSVRSSTRDVKHKPEINTTLHAMDFNDKENREFEVMLNLARKFRNLVTGDAQRLSRCDRAIRENHTFRFVATGGANEYAFDIYYIDRKADSDFEDYEKQYLMTWRPDKPPEDFCEFIEDKDDEWKKDRMDEGIETIEEKREQEEQEQNIVRA